MSCASYRPRVSTRGAIPAQAASAPVAERRVVRGLPSERSLSNPSDGAPLPDSQTEQPPVIRRADAVAFAQVGLLIIGVVAALYLAKAFFLPVVTAFVVGTMLSPATSFHERYRMPRPRCAVQIVAAVGAAAALI